MLQPAVILLGVLAFVLLASVVFTAVRGREPVRHHEPRRASTWLIWAAGLLGTGVTFYDWIVWRAQAIDPTAALAGGMCLLCGMVLRVQSRRALGRFYTPHICVMENHQLVRSGIYRRLRHPGYLGFILWAVGVAVGLASWFGLALMLAGFIPAVLYRIRQEERLLQAHFGPEWERYAAQTWRLIPRLY